jgi:hypothetical protein
MGKGWVDFSRGIHTITLFGRGFGDLIERKPAIPGVIHCSQWWKIPKKKSYLTVRIVDLQRLMVKRRDSSETCNLQELPGDLIWMMKPTLFDTCPCTVSHPTKCRDPVQAVFPSVLVGILKKKPGVHLEAAGAVIFGHNVTIPWYWPDEGDRPVKGELPQLGAASPTSSQQAIPSSAPQSPSTLSGSGSQPLTSTSSTNDTGFLTLPTTTSTAGSSSAAGGTSTPDSSTLTRTRKRMRQAQDAVRSIPKRVKF